MPLGFDRSKQTLAAFGFRASPGSSPESPSRKPTRTWPACCRSGWTPGQTARASILITFYEEWRITPAIRPLKEEVIGSIGNVLWLVMGTIGVVMLIACTNVANLLLVRADARRQELAVRAAHGRGTSRIAWELLLESLCLGFLGGVLGVGIAYEGLRLLVAIGPANLPRLAEISLDTRSLGFTLGPLCIVRPDIWIHSGATVCAGAHSARTSRRRANRERGLGTPTVPRFAGGGPGGDGTGPAGQRHVDDSHFPCTAPCRAGVHTAGAFANNAYFDSGFFRC